MSIHIAAKKGEIAKRVLLPGDPLRAKYIAEKFLKDVKEYNSIRNMLGFTGTNYRGVRVSVQGGGMGMASLGIYVNELTNEYDVSEIIRVGTCGSLQEDLGLGDIILAQGACSESNMNRRRFKEMDYAPLADFHLLRKAYEIGCRQVGLNHLRQPVVGNILSAEMFYNDVDLEEWKLWAKYGVLGVEMESAELYTLCAKKGVAALSILTVSDNLATHQKMPPEERERGLDRMVQIALNI